MLRDQRKEQREGESSWGHLQRLAVGVVNVCAEGEAQSAGSRASLRKTCILYFQKGIVHNILGMCGVRYHCTLYHDQAKLATIVGLFSTHLHLMRSLQRCYLERNVLPKSYGFHTDSLSILKAHQIVRFQVEVRQPAVINSDTSWQSCLFNHI